MTRRIVDVATGHPTTSPTSRALTGARHEIRRPVGTSRRRSAARRALTIQLRSERTVPVAVGLVVLLAGVVSLGPGAVQPVGAAQVPSPAVRLAIGGGVAAQRDPAVLSDVSAATSSSFGDYVDDGTLYKPVAVDTSIETSLGMLRRYVVKAGDTLSTIAGRFDVSVMTIWWANNLSSTTKLHVGQTLVIPPVNGLVITVKLGDTLAGLATKYKVSPDAILEANALEDSNLVIGQVLLVPGAKGAPIPTPKPKPSSSGSSTTTHHYYPPSSGWHWPVLAGGSYISQYYSSYHPAVDIADKYGTPVGAPHAGKVIKAGWYLGGEGYTVWIYIGNGMYTCEEHFSKVLVSVGQWVTSGQLVGRMGMSGNATGPHVHVEVWVGEPWMPGSYRINPLRYL